MTNGLKVDETQFREMDHGMQNLILFQNTERILLALECQKTECYQKFDKIEKRKRFDTGIGAFSGFLGGMCAMIGKWLIIK